MAIAAFNSAQPAPKDELRRMKREFLAALSQEIRTPLAGILGMADLLLETHLDEDQQSYVATTRTCAEELLEQLSCALRLSELVAGRTVLEESEFNLPELFESVAAEYQPKAEAKGLTFSLSVDRGLPQCAVGDCVRLREVLSQLVANSIKFTAEGEVGIRAAAEPAAAGRCRLSIEVRDTGIGIAAGQLPAVFEAFRQAEGGIARRYPGLGLGLTLVQRLVRLMRGDVKVSSEPGRGSVVSLAVPLRIATRERRTPASPKPAARLCRILVVEENPVSRRNIAQALVRRKYDVETVPNAEAALVEAVRRRYDAVLLEVKLPGTDGFEAVRAIRELPGYESVPVLALAAPGSVDAVTACLKQGLQGAVEKPVNARELMAALDRVLA
jgi:CheY-like chemotaxis protein